MKYANKDFEHQLSVTAIAIIGFTLIIALLGFIGSAVFPEYNNNRQAIRSERVTPSHHAQKSITTVYHVNKKG